MTISVRYATPDDLNAINCVIDAAVMAWPLAQRVKRLSLSALRYDAQDYEHFEMFVALKDNEIVGVAVWDPVDESGLFHGLYVEPKSQRAGVGKRLMQRVLDRASYLGHESVLVRAERVSAGYFERQRFERVIVSESEYPYQYRRKLG